MRNTTLLTLIIVIADVEELYCSRTIQSLAGLNSESLLLSTCPLFIFSDTCVSLSHMQLARYPDRPFHSFGARKTVDRRIICNSKLSLDGF